MRIDKERDCERMSIGIDSRDILRHGVDKEIERLRQQIKKLESKKAVPTIEPSMTLGVAIITKNGANTILRAIKSMSGYADECVVVDTGSTDGTRKLLENYGFTVGLGGDKRMYTFKWCDDFSAARNYAQSKCKADYILWLDDDDEVPEDTAKLIKAAMDNPGPKTTNKTVSFSLNMINVVNDQPIGEQVMQPRIYPNVDNIHWEGSIHESYIPSLEKLGIQNVSISNAYIHHWGYNSPELNEQKNRRNMEYLKREEKSPMSLYHLGTTSMCMNSMEDAVKYYEEMLEAYPHMQEEFKDHVKYMLATCYIDLGGNEKALTLLENNTKPDAKFWLAEICLRMGEITHAINGYWKYLGMKDITDPWGTKSLYYRHCCYMRLKEIYSRKLEYIEESCKQEYPEEVQWK